jgi:hypothetical protein
MKPKTYFFIRMTATAFSLVAGSLTVLQVGESPLAEFPPLMLWVLAGASFLGLLLTPLLVAGIIRIQSLSGSPAEPLCRPSNSVNPMSFRTPHLLFHFGALFVMAHGAGTLLTSPLGGMSQLVEGAFQLAGGAACLAGVYLGINWCGKGLRERNAETPNRTSEPISNRADAV